MKYICSVCGYIYDEAREKVPFSELPDSWKCPVCKAAKSVFVPEKKKEEPKAAVSPVPAVEAVSEDGDLVKLSVGALSALCSNLARGCEKQYRPQEEALFRELADYLAAAAPAVHPRAHCNARRLPAPAARHVRRRRWPDRRRSGASLFRSPESGI